MRSRYRRRRRHRRSRGYNGASIVAAAKSNLSVNRGMQAVAFLAGGAANEMLTQFAVRLINRFAPSVTPMSPIGLAAGVLMSGVTGKLAGKVKPAYAFAASTGALADALAKVGAVYAPGVMRYLTPGAPAPMVVAPAPVSTTKGYMGDYLTPGDVARARSLGDYLTPGDVARARSLGYGEDLQDMRVGDELAAM